MEVVIGIFMPNHDNSCYRYLIRRYLIRHYLICHYLIRRYLICRYFTHLAMPIWAILWEVKILYIKPLTSHYVLP